MNMDAEIIEAEEVPFSQSYNPNKTAQIVNLVQISPKVEVDVPSIPESKRKKLTKETISTVLNLYNQVCEENGFKVQWNIESIQKNFENIIKDDDEQIFRILVSKAFSKFQLVFYQQAMINIMTLMNQVSSPEVINDASVSIDYKYGMMNSLLSLMDQVSNMYEKVKVDNADLILKNLAEKSTGGGLDSIQMDPQIIEVMKQLRNISLGIKEQE